MTFGFEAEYSVEARALDEVATDFGNLTTKRPRAVVRARSVADVVNAVRVAREHKVPLVARGEGHTTRGQSLAPDGIILDMRALASVEIANGSARVGAGITWDTLLAKTTASGQTPPTLTDYLGLSVGGTLSVGGVGGQSFRHGLQTDNVLELSVVTGTGELVRCSRVEHKELFDACRGGLGQYGIIVEAQLSLVPAPDAVTIYKVSYPDLDSYLAAQERLVDANGFDYILGSVRPVGDRWTYEIELLRYSNREDSELQALAGLGGVDESAGREQRSFFDYATRLRQMVLEMKEAGTWSSFHPWMDLFVPASTAKEIIATALELFAPRDLANGYVMTYPLRRHVLDSPCLGLPAEANLYLFDLLPNIPLDRRAELETFERQCKCLYEAASTRDARVYAIGYPLGSMTTADWQRQLGDYFAPLLEVKRNFDPDGILGADLEIFSRHEGRAM